MKGDLTNVKVGTQDLVDYSYDSLGKLSTKSYENGQSISYTYSGDNIATISYGATLAFEFTYTDGVLTSKIDHINNTTTSYLGDIVEVRSGGNIISSYNKDIAFEADGSAYQVLTETNGTDTYTTQNHENYDVFGLSGGSTSLYKGFTRTDGRVDSTNVKLNSLSGTTLMTTNYSYSGDNLTQVSNVIGSTTKAFDYTYDSEDRISKISCGCDDVEYFYDSKDQLIRVNDEILSKTFTYSYDARGNLTSKSIYAYTTAEPITGTPTLTDSYSYGDSNWPDKLTSYNGQAITYDDNGNTLSYKGYTMSWVGGRMLDSMVGNGKSIYFNYDDQGIRTQKTMNGTVTKYTTIDGRITSQKDGTNTMYFHYDQNNELAGVMINGNEYLYVRNLQGDIVSLVDTAGNIVVNYSYNAWGKVQSITGSLASTIGEINPMRYRGYYQDVETGLYYLQSRYYDPDTCRMINADEPGIIANLARCDNQSNLFAYVGNNPANYVDPSGYGFVTDLLTLISIILTCASLFIPAWKIAFAAASAIVGIYTVILAISGYVKSHERNISLWRHLSISYSTYNYREKYDKMLLYAGLIAGGIAVIVGIFGKYVEKIVVLAATALFLDVSVSLPISTTALLISLANARKGIYGWI